MNEPAFFHQVFFVYGDINRENAYHEVNCSNGKKKSASDIKKCCIGHIWGVICMIFWINFSVLYSLW